MEFGKLDLSVLDGINIPEIKTGRAVGESTKDDITVIPEVGSIEEINQNEFTEETDEDEIPEVEAIGDLDNDDESFDNSIDEVIDESPIKVWSQFASERGLIDLEDGEEIGDSEDFLVKKFNDKVDKGINSYKESLPEELRELVNAWEQGVPVDKLIEAESRIMDLSSIDAERLTEDVSLQKQLVAALLRVQEYDDSEIEAKIEKLEDNLLLEDEAKHALKKLDVFEKRQKATLIEESKKNALIREKQYKENLDAYTTKVMGKEEIIKGIPVTKEQREAIVKLTTKPVAIDKNGNGITLLKKMEMEDPDFLLKIAYLASMNWDLSTIEKKATTKATREVRKKVETYKEGNSALNKLDLKSIQRAIKISRNQLFK